MLNYGNMNLKKWAFLWYTFEREIITDYNFLELLNLNFADNVRLGVFH